MNENGQKRHILLRLSEMYILKKKLGFSAYFLRFYGQSFDSAQYRALHGRPKLGEEIIFLLKTVLDSVGELLRHLAEKK